MGFVNTGVLAFLCSGGLTDELPCETDKLEETHAHGRVLHSVVRQYKSFDVSYCILNVLLTITALDPPQFR